METYLPLVQGGYYAVTGLWPILSMRTFLIVTGPKTQLWLVKTVGALVIAIAAPLLWTSASGRLTPEIILLAAGSACVLGLVDVNYWAKGAISPVYLFDALVEFVLVGLWASLVLRMGL